MTSLLLDLQAWDLVADAAGNLAVCQDPYAIAQDTACACRLFKGELWYDSTQGVPYFQKILGKLPPLAFVKAQLNAAAMTVPGVSSATTFIGGLVNRQLTGQVQVTTTSGVQLTATIGPSAIPWYVTAAAPDWTTPTAAQPPAPAGEWWGQERWGQFPWGG